MTEQDRERDTLPPGNESMDPADLLATTAVRLEAIASALSMISAELSIVARNLTMVQETQRAHGTAIGALQSSVGANTTRLESLHDWLTRLDTRVAELEQASMRRSL
jgi:hypothetical protein